MIHACHTQGSRPVTQGLSSASELLSGDVIIIGPRKATAGATTTANAVAAVGAGALLGGLRNVVVRSPASICLSVSSSIDPLRITGGEAGEAGAAFVPYAQYAFKGTGNGGKQARSFSELELYKVFVGDGFGLWVGMSCALRYDASSPLSYIKFGIHR